jgi:hypothetical protein
MMWTELGQVEGSCEFGIEPSGFIKYWETIKSILTTRDLSSSAQLHIVS